ncbi:Uncharacterised protein [Streptococcus pneumoniae]|nr:Uncharacterised protein [Streptococcus pneumoniae]
MRSNLAKTQSLDAPCQQVTIKERQQIIEQFEEKHYGLSSLLKERLLITSDYQFTRKMNELRAFARMAGFIRVRR